MIRGTDLRRRRKRRGGDGETAPVAAPAEAPAFEAELCELVDVGGGDALLRVVGRWSPGSPERIDLVCFGDGGIERVEPLPPGAATAADGLWHVAFWVPEEASGQHLALMTSEGTAVGLPAPARPLSAPIAPSIEERELAAERSARADAEERLRHALEDLADAQSVTRQLRRRCELSERGLADFRDKLVAAWGEAASMRDLLDEREAAHEAAKQRAREADEAVAEIEARARRSRRELAARRDELEQQCVRLHAELEQRDAAELSAAEQLAMTAALRADAADALARFEAARTEADAYSERLAKAERELDEARQDAATARAKSAALEAQPAQAAIEADLRHLLEVRERELRDARTELAEQRERYAAAASEVQPPESPAAQTGDDAKAAPWSRVDEDLLERLARAKSLAGEG